MLKFFALVILVGGLVAAVLAKMRARAEEEREQRLLAAAIEQGLDELGDE